MFHALVEAERGAIDFDGFDKNSSSFLPMPKMQQ